MPNPEDASDQTVQSSRPPSWDAATLPPDAPPGDEPPTDGVTVTGFGAARAMPPGEPEPPAGYAFERELGRGGMGVVYLARNLALNRPVALKMVLSGAHASPNELTRFVQEAESVAQLRHPNVVQIFEVGSHEGRPFMALEFCDGGGLDRKFGGNPIPANEAAALVASLAGAVEAAHRAGIVHRDLKPQNVLLASDGAPKITDFGLAKRAGGTSELTATGAILGTPSYMAPEQAEGRGKEVGPLADVYALGAILYEGLTGRPPFRAATPLDTVLQVVKDEPVPPRQLNPQVPADLETIALKCLQKDPARRYASAAELADDLTRFREGRPIVARPVGRAERAWKWARRNKALAGGTAAVAVALLLGTAVATWQAVRASAEATRADGKAAEAEVSATEARRQGELALGSAEAARREEARARDEEKRAVQALADLKAERGQSAEFRYANRVNRAYAEWQALNTNYARLALADTPAALRGWEWAFLDRQFEQSSVVLRGHGGFVASVALSPDAGRAYTVGFDKTIRTWDARSGAESRALPVAGHRLALSPDGRRMVVATGHAIRLYDPDAGRELKTASLGAFPLGMAFVRGGKELAVVASDGSVTFRDPDSLAERRRAAKRLDLDRGSVQLLNAGLGTAISPDGRFVAQGGADCKVRVWDAATGERLLDGEGHLKLVGEPSFSPDGRFLASPGGEGQIRIWDLETKQVARVLRGHKAWVWSVAYSPDGKRLASASKDFTVRVWDPNTGDPLLPLVGHGSETRALAWSADGVRLVSGSPDATARVWNPSERVVGAEHVRKFFADRKLPDFARTGSAEHLTFYGHVAPAMSVACSPDGRLVATSAAGDDEAEHQVVVWDVEARREVAKFPGPKVRGHALAFTPDGKRLLVGSAPGANAPCRVVAYDVASGKDVWTWTGPGATLVHPAVSPDGGRVAVLTQGQRSRLAVLDAATGAEAFHKELANHVGPAFVGERSVAVADVAAGTVRLFDAASGEPVREWAASNSGVTAIASGPDGRLATADGRATVKVWDTTTGRERMAMEGHAGVVQQMTFGPAGRLASVANDFTARVWNTDTGHELLIFRDHADVPTGVAWSRDGSRLATSCADGALRVWQGPQPDAADTADAWPVRFADRFDAAPSAQWHPVLGEWKWQDGAYRGTLRPKTAGEAKFNAAQVGLKGVAVPTRADVRYRFRPSRPMTVTVPMTDRSGWKMIYQPLVSGPCKMAGSPAAFLMQITMPTGKLEDMKVANSGRGAKFEMEGGKWYSVRLLREPERLRLWIDGHLILTERIPNIDLPGIGWQGSWSEDGDTIDLDDVEVRAPDDAVRELAVRSRVLDLFEQVQVRSEVRRQLTADPATTAADLAAVDRALAELPEDARKLQAASWAVVQRPGADAEAYRLALAQAEAAVRDDPTDPDALGVFGLALVRAGRAKEALTVLDRAVVRTREEFGAASPSQYAARALARHALGDTAGARSDATQVRALLLSTLWSGKPAAKALAAEVGGVVGAGDAAADAVVSRVFAGETAGWAHHDVAAYLDIHTADAVAVKGRGPEPGAHDVALNRAQLEATRRVQFRGPGDPNVAFLVEDVAVTVDGDAADLRWRLTAQFNGGHETFGCRYSLVKAGGVWRAKELRSWDVARLAAGERTEVTADAWAARDRAADALQGSPDAVARVAALRKAGRTAEAFRVAKDATDAGTGGAALWSERGDLALTLGDVPAAMTCFAKAEALDPDAALPWYTTRARVAFREHGSNGAAGASFFPQGNRVASAGNDGRVRVWDADTGKEASSLDADEPLNDVTVSRDGKRLAAVGQTLFVFDAKTGAKVAVGKGHTGMAYRVGFSPDGTKVATAGADGTARVWDAATGKELAKFAGHGKPVLGVCFSPDGRHVASCGDDDLIRLWDADTAAEVRAFKGHTKGVKRAVFSPDGTRLASVSIDRTVRLWDAATGELLKTLEDAHDQTADAAAFSADGRLLATGDWGGVVRVWDAVSGAKRVTVRNYPGGVYGLSFRADGRALAAAGNGPVVVFDLRPLDE